MATDWQGPEIRCPFFLEAGVRFIRCEGIFPETLNTVTFRNPVAREAQMEETCMGNYCKCGVYRQVEAKYES